ncbi:helix-turn-helix transcriptional regulator [Chelatococcus sp.]|uniref:helix-turn-helix domain-containing protein n=1 Tax=Chelatococcus sp. TaxID=1953771 RepID=UPI001EB3AD27|nr:helix-turn-helix transcriptional regulator [Chelatococcus sp.]MBX3543602.1 helix-turn-helix transcriptional regulator [Chelatococcus sp.]
MRLLAYLQTKKISGADFARMIGASQAAVNRYCNGRRMPHAAMLLKIHEITGGQVTPNDFLFETTAPPTVASASPSAAPQSRAGGEVNCREVV